MYNTFVLDTNLFINLQSGLCWGENPKENIIEFIKKTTKLTKDSKAFFYMTPSILDELKGFFDGEPDYLSEFLVLIRIKSPDLTKIAISAQVFRDFVDEVRLRSYRGMKVGEEEMDAVGRHMIVSENISKQDFQRKIGEVVVKYRARYRNATRVNFLDSPADLDLILLAKELKGALVSADEGLMRWGRKIGANEVSPLNFGEVLSALA